MYTQQNRFPCFYHPTRTLFLDDNESFLQTMVLSFDRKLDLLTTSNCQQALEILNTFDESSSVKKLIFHTHAEESTLASQIVECNVSDLHHMIYDVKRFQTVSALVVDYQMPAMNGVEFCKRIQNPHVMKILLTAEADNDIAISAFNQGLIHQFILKTRDDLDEALIAAITQLQQTYFIHLSQCIYDNMDQQTLAWVSSSKYRQLFAETKQVSQAVEYYLLDKFGSLLFLDRKGEPTWLIYRDEQALREYEAIAKEQEASQQVITSLKTRKQLLFQLTRQDMQLPITKWPKYLFDANKLEENYYYSIIHTKTNNAINWNRIASYD